MHLVLVGVLCWRSGFVPRVIGVLVVLAGAAYAVDSIGVLLSASYDLELAAFLFVGEVALMVWLIWWGTRGGRAMAGHDADSGGETSARGAVSDHGCPVRGAGDSDQPSPIRMEHAVPSHRPLSMSMSSTASSPA